MRAAVAAAVVLAIPALSRPAAQTSRAAGQNTRAAAHRVQRTSWGHPDLQGRWTNASLTPLERPASLGTKEFFTPAEAAEYKAHALQTYLDSTNQSDDISGERPSDLWGEERTIVPTLRTSLIVGPRGRVPPLTDEARRRAAARAASRIGSGMDDPEQRPLNERCLFFSADGPPMLPSITYNSNYEIVQTPGAVMIHIEMGNGVRIIPLDNRPHLPSSMRQWLGDARGRWDGDALVVDTTNVSDKRDTRGSAGGLHVVERFTRTSEDTLMYRFTVDDPATWTEPWSGEIPMRPLDGLVYEYGCHEGNRSLANVLSGARATDR
jgi:hypothetical protein